MRIRRGHKRGSLAVELEANDARLFETAASPSQTDAFGIRIKTILVPIDFSDCSKRALRSAVAFAKQYGANITLLAVVPDERTSFEYGEAEFLSLQKWRMERYERELQGLIDTLGAGVPIHFQVRAGRPFQEIVDAARSLNADVIVISTHGQRGPVPSTLGSTTEKVIRHAPCPVIVVREKGRDLARGEAGDREMPESPSYPIAPSAAGAERPGDATLVTPQPS